MGRDAVQGSGWVIGKTGCWSSTEPVFPVLPRKHQRDIPFSNALVPHTENSFLQLPSHLVIFPALGGFDFVLPGILPIVAYPIVVWVENPFLYQGTSRSQVL